MWPPLFTRYGMEALMWHNGEGLHSVDLVKPLVHMPQQELQKQGPAGAVRKREH